METALGAAQHDVSRSSAGAVVIDIDLLLNSPLEARYGAAASRDRTGPSVIVQGVEKLCAALGLDQPLDSPTRFSEANLNSESACVKNMVKELLQLSGKMSRATGWRHGLKTTVIYVLEEVCGCNLGKHGKKIWVDGRTEKDHEYSVVIKDPYAICGSFADGVRKFCDVKNDREARSGAKEGLPNLHSYKWLFLRSRR